MRLAPKLTPFYLNLGEINIYFVLLCRSFCSARYSCNRSWVDRTWRYCIEKKKKIFRSSHYYYYFKLIIVKYYSIINLCEAPSKRDIIQLFLFQIDIQLFLGAIIFNYSYLFQINILYYDFFYDNLVNNRLFGYSRRVVFFQVLI